MFQLEVVDDFGPGLTRVPVNAKPVMPSEPGEPSDPLEGASKAERRAWSKKHQAKEVRTWSSTNVRYLLSQGRIKDADAILGHAHAVEGTVVHGEERGRTIGFPTANLSENVAGYLPVDGVYAGWLVDLGEKSADGGEEAGEKPADGVSQQYDASSVNARVAMQSPHRWPAAISIGTKPTFNEDGDAERVVEAYAITDDWLDLYGHQARVEFAGFLRPQIKFDSADDLVVELKRNVEETKRLTACDAICVLLPKRAFPGCKMRMAMPFGHRRPIAESRPTRPATYPPAPRPFPARRRSCAASAQRRW